MYVCTGELLLCAGDCSTALCGVQCALALDRGLALRNAGSADLAADFGNGAPVAVGHDCGCVWMCG